MDDHMDGDEPPAPAPPPPPAGNNIVPVHQIARMLQLAPHAVAQMLHGAPNGPPPAGLRTAATANLPIGRRPAPRHASLRPASTTRGVTFSTAEIESFLSVLERYLPIGPEEWEQVTMEHNMTYPNGNRTTDSLRRKFATLYRKKVPTGDPSCPPEVRRAKRLHQSIRQRAEMGSDVSDEDLDLVDDDMVQNEDEPAEAILNTPRATVVPQINGGNNIAVTTGPPLYIGDNRGGGSSSSTSASGSPRDIPGPMPLVEAMPPLLSTQQAPMARPLASGNSRNGSRTRSPNQGSEQGVSGLVEMLKMEMVMRMQSAQAEREQRQLELEAEKERLAAEREVENKRRDDDREERRLSRERNDQFMQMMLMSVIGGKGHKRKRHERDDEANSDDDSS